MPLTPLTAGLSIATQAVSEFSLVQPDVPVSTLERRYTDEHSDFVDVDDTRIHYREEGNPDGPTVLLLHGTFSSLHTWDGWVDELGEAFRLVRLDMPGFGLTGPREEGEHTLEALVDIVGAFCDELGLSDVAVAGSSLGGGVAWRMAVSRPDLVSKLVLVSAGGSTLLSNIVENYRMFGSSALARYVTPRMLVRMLVRDAYADNSKVTEPLVRRYHDLVLRKGNRRAVLEIAQNYRRQHLPDEDVDLFQTPSSSARILLPSSCHSSPTIYDTYDISDVSVPTLALWGAQDRWLSVDFGLELVRKIPNSKFIAYRDVGHLAMEETPALTAADAGAFLTTGDVAKPWQRPLDEDLKTRLTDLSIPDFASDIDDERRFFPSAPQS